MQIRSFRTRSLLPGEHRSTATITYVRQLQNGSHHGEFGPLTGGDCAAERSRCPVGGGGNNPSNGHCQISWIEEQASILCAQLSHSIVVLSGDGPSNRRHDPTGDFRDQGSRPVGVIVDHNVPRGESIEIDLCARQIHVAELPAALPAGLVLRSDADKEGGRVLLAEKLHFVLENTMSMVL